MIRINLLPFRAERRKETIRRQVALFLLSVIALCFLLYVGGNIMQGYIDGYKADITATKNELNVYKDIIKEIDQIKKNLDILKKKIEVIKSLSQMRKEPVELLKIVSDTMVRERMWLTDFNESDKKVRVEGIATDDKTIADFMKNVELEKKFDNVSLGPIMLIQKDGRKLKTFKLDFDIKQPETAQANKDSQGSQ